MAVDVVREFLTRSDLVARQVDMTCQVFPSEEAKHGKN